MTRPLLYRVGLAALGGVLAAGCVAPLAGARELGVVRTGTAASPGIFDGAVAGLADEAGIAGLLPRLEAWLARQPSEKERLEWATRQLVPDWSGDGRPDDVSVHYVFELQDLAVRTITTMRAVEGDTGKLLWQRRWDRGDDTWVAAIPARVGPKAVAGAILTEVRGAALGTSRIDYTFRGVTGSGKNVWMHEHSSTIVGTWPASFTATDYLTGAGPFDALPGRATDFLLASGAISTVGPWAGVVRAAVIDGRDGSLVEHPVPEVGVGFIPEADVFGDLDGDGLDDYVFTNERPNAAPSDEGETLPVTVATGIAAARKGIDGAALWTAGGLDFSNRNVQMSDIGDVVGSSEGDVFVETDWQVFGPEKNPDEYLTYLIDGRSGAVVWKRRGQWPHSPGDVDGDGSRDVLLQHYYGTDGFVATHVRAFTDHGRLLWQREYRTEHPLQTCCSWLLHFGESWSAGDLDGDGLSDGYIEHSAGPYVRRDLNKFEHFVVDAASGRILAEGGVDFTALGEPAVDAAGADYALLAWSAGGLSVEVRDGVTGAVLTRSRLELDVPIDPKNLWLYAETGRLDGDRCGDPVIQVESATGIYEVALDGADGTMLWGRSIGRRGGQVHLASSEDANDAC